MEYHVATATSISCALKGSGRKWKHICTCIEVSVHQFLGQFLTFYHAPFSKSRQFLTLIDAFLSLRRTKAWKEKINIKRWILWSFNLNPKYQKGKIMEIKAGYLKFTQFWCSQLLCSTTEMTHDFHGIMFPHPETRETARQSWKKFISGGTKKRKEETVEKLSIQFAELSPKIKIYWEKYEINATIW